ncbi:MAG: type IV pilus secretin PilQ [endosymbiont of Galathealinum brachiosum]|uniref:Type IV pilus secretin PilQ n=1 Tax=endosymbiont of Galathealinum brachiosum TaxID=2200906 RepID=A0A370DA19_9GAMM|nr:MAG: type IV pilus secretin PilQ [endosymbiont of Galathealinum brachiosum]
MLMMLSGLNVQTAIAAINNIEEITYSSLPGNRLQINIRLTEVSEKPLSFNIDNPARIAFDFKNTKSNLPKRKQQIGIGVAQSLTTVTVKNKTRVILNLSDTVPYDVSVNRNVVSVTLESESTNAIESAKAKSGLAAMTDTSGGSSRSVTKIDFRRGDKGEGRVLLSLSEASIPMDISEEFGKVVVSFSNTSLPKDLHQRLDVLDFATPVKTIDSFQIDGNSRILIEPSHKDFTHLAYQTDKLFTIEFIPVSKNDLEEQKKAKFGYTGERLSLNFQDIPVRAVLQLIADFTGLNVVVSDSVDGNLTLRLKNVPWDQALDIILKAKGLSKRESGNVMLIAPSEEIAAQEKIDLEAQSQITELAPIRSAFFEINFAKVTDLAQLFEGDGEEGSLTLLSPRGSVIMDERTNTLIVKDTDAVISEIRRTLAKLDIPVRQVLIESRIVIATDNFKKELGVRFGATSVRANGSDGLKATSGTIGGTNTIVDSGIDNLGNTGSVFPVTSPSGISADRLNVNMPVVGAAGSIAFTILSGGNLLDLELSALQAEDDGEIISSPRVVTSDRHEAFIEQGVEIPYLSATSSGATQVEFKKAVLSIRVTPQITPDDRIIMDLSVNKDAVGEVFANIPSIDTRQVTTQVLVENGDTIVLGGIYETETRNELDKVPVLGDLPLIGSLFRHTLESTDKQELLIFVTPKILKDSLSL